MADIDLILSLNVKFNFDINIISKTNTIIHSNDEMLGPGGKEHYFNVGLSALDCINKGINVSGKNISDINKILDFPCGYGRVLRFIKSFFANADIYAAEISESYLNFCRDTFGVKVINSHKNFNKIVLNEKFDLIWCGSLFTHLNSRRFYKLLNFFESHLENSGLLIFSVHGRFAYNNIRNFDYGLRLHQKSWVRFRYNLFNFAYVNYLKQFGYGVSFCKPSWVCSNIEKFTNLKLIAYMEKAWDNHHDIVVCKREKFF